MTKYRYWLLPFLGGLSGWLSFAIASPFISSLDRMTHKKGDLSTHFTLGSVWPLVQHGAMGLLLCGSFCCVLEAGHRTPRRFLQSVSLAALWGAVINIGTDALQDFLNAKLPGFLAPGEQARHWLYNFFIAASMVLPVLLAIGVTPQRLRRAGAATLIATLMAIFGNAIAQVVIILAEILKISKDLNSPKNHELPLTIWGTESMIIGICVGFAFLLTELYVRSGSVRLILGTNEFLDWSLDHERNRIGSGEVEIPIRGFKDVEPVHCCIFRHDNQFTLDGNHAETYLNGKLITQEALRDGDTVQIGSATLLFYSGTPVMRQWGATAPIVQLQAEVCEVRTPGPEFFLVDLAGKRYLLEPGSNTVGREVGYSICLSANSTVSRQHALVKVEQDQVVLVDLGSANGTMVNRVPVLSPTILKSGDEVMFGSAILMFELHTR